MVYATHHDKPGDSVAHWLAIGLASCSGILALLVCTWFVGWGLLDPGEHTIFALGMGSVPLIFVGVATLGVLKTPRGRALRWCGALLFALVFFAPGLLGILFFPSIVLMLAAVVFAEINAREHQRRNYETRA